VPLLYSWADLVVEGGLDDSVLHADASAAAAELG
jgi:hypothetical protein